MDIRITTLQKPIVAAVVLGFLLLIWCPNFASAASGGRMGGSFFSDSSSSSSSSYSSSSYSSSSSSLSYTSYSYSSDFDYPAESYSSVRRSGDRVAAAAAGPTSQGGDNDDFNNALYIIIPFLFVLFCWVLYDEHERKEEIAASKRTTVLMLQVGLLSMRKSIQKELNGICETADTSTLKGLHYILTGTALALLRHTDRCIFAYSSADVRWTNVEGEHRFNQLSVEERRKFDKETLINVNNIKKKQSKQLLTASGCSSDYVAVDVKGSMDERDKNETHVTADSIKEQSSKASAFRNEYIVITILVAARGEHELPCINNTKDLKEALTKLASIPSTRTVAVEVLWTPQDEDDSLLELELHQDYPLLRPLKDGIEVERHSILNVLFTKVGKCILIIKNKLSFTKSKGDKDKIDHDYAPLDGQCGV